MATPHTSVEEDCSATPLRKTRLTVGQLHNVPNSRIYRVVVVTGRRNTIGTNGYGGIRLTGDQTELTHFETKESALAFIDAIHSYGLPHAVKMRLHEQEGKPIHTYTTTDVVEQFAYQPGGDISPSEYIRKIGVGDPMNVFIRPVVHSTTRL